MIDSSLALFIFVIVFMFTPPSFLLAAMSSIFLFIFLHNADVSILHLTCVYIIHIRKGVGLAIPGCTLILCCDR